MSTIIRKSKHRWLTDIIAEINIILLPLGLLIKEVDCTNKARMFTYLIYDSTDQAIQGWKLKLPYTSLVTDKHFSDELEQNAAELKVNSFFVWNFTKGILYTKDENNVFFAFKTWNGTNRIKTANDVITYKEDWLPIIKTIILEINQYLRKDNFKLSKLGGLVLEDLMLLIMQSSKIGLAEYIKENAVKNPAMRSELNAWWSHVKTEYIFNEPNLYLAYAKVVVLNWLHRLLFAHLIKGYHEAAKDIQKIHEGVTPSEANEIIQRISSICGFKEVFSAIQFNELLTDKVWKEIIKFNVFLKDKNVDCIEKKSLKNILENTVSMFRREIIGKLTTPDELAEFLASLTIDDMEGDCLDPCCGTGTIAKAILKIKMDELGIQKAYETTWASDNHSFALQLANMSLTSYDALNIPYRVFKEDVFKLAYRKQISIVDPIDGIELNVSLPGKFKSIVSNLPFIRFENINIEEKAYIKNIRRLTKQSDLTMMDRKGDICSYITFSLWNLLDDGGKLGIIVSNSCLETDWGCKFINLLLYYYDIKAFITSGTGRWFKNFDAVTIIIILQKKVIAKPALDSQISFCVLKKNINELAVSQEMMNTAVNSIKLSDETVQEVLSLKKYSINEIEILRNLSVYYNTLFHRVDWLTKIQKILIRITDLFYITREEQRESNKFFYPRCGHGIEKDYMKPVLKNPKNLNTLVGKTDTEVFCCSLTLDKLVALKHNGAVNWITKFETNAGLASKYLPEVINQQKQSWYEIPISAKADMVTIMNPDFKLFVSRFNEPVFVDPCFVCINRISEDVDLDVCHALLNCVLAMFYIEAVGLRKKQDVLDINSNNLKKMFMLNPNILTTPQKKSIVNAFKPLLTRKVLSAEEELLSSEDRQAFDKLVLESYGIGQYYDDICYSLLSMQKQRGLKTKYQ